MTRKAVLKRLQDAYQLLQDMTLHGEKDWVNDQNRLDQALSKTKSAISHVMDLLEAKEKQADP